jgi:hypothetical protein
LRTVEAEIAPDPPPPCRETKASVVLEGTTKLPLDVARLVWRTIVGPIRLLSVAIR